MIPQRGLLGNKTWRETQIDLEVYELNVDLILTAKRFSPVHIKVFFDEKPAARWHNVP
jgi:hypothetical protein